MADTRAADTPYHTPLPPTPPPPAQVSPPSTRGGPEPQVSGAAAGDATVPADDASSVDHVQEKGAVVKLSKWQRFKAHFKRRWWWYLIGLIIFLAILLPILFEVIIPAIIQNVVNGQDLPILKGELRAVSPDKVNFTIFTELETPLEVTIDPIELSLYEIDNQDADSPFVQLTLPKTKVHETTGTSITNQTAPILDMDTLIRWFNNIFDNPSADVQVKADLKVHLGELDYDADLDKSISVPALNYLEGFGINEMEFLVPADENGYNIRGYLNLPNAGVLTLYLGNTSFNMLAGDVNLGLVHLYDVEMKPGDNSPYFEGNFYFNELVPNLGALLDGQADALSRGVIELHAKGNTTFINGEHIPYLEQVLNRKRIPIEIGVITLLGDVVNGLISSDNVSASALLGDTIGNATLIDQLLSNWEDTSTEEDSAEKKRKRSTPKRSQLYNMLRLGLMTRRNK